MYNYDKTLIKFEWTNSMIIKHAISIITQLSWITISEGREYYVSHIVMETMRYSMVDVK